MPSLFSFSWFDITESKSAISSSISFRISTTKVHFFLGVLKITNLSRHPMPPLYHLLDLPVSSQKINEQIALISLNFKLT
jgi:hypothetical protein